MFIGLYVCLSGTIGLVALVALLARVGPATSWRQVRRGVVLYLLIASLGSLLGLLGFIGLSLWSGVLRVGQPQSYSLPGDYLALGPVGWLTLGVAVRGILSPVAAAALSQRRTMAAR